MEIKRLGLGLFASLLMLPLSMRRGHADGRSPATFEITIKDENGVLVPHAHVFIFSRNKKQFFGTREAYGIATFGLPEGDYRVFAAETMPNQGAIEHYSTPEAFVHLSADQPASIILYLHKADEGDSFVTETALQKMGIDTALAKDLN